jgi:transposase
MAVSDRSARDRRSHDWREARRLQALELERKGWPHKTIAEALGVSQGAVSRWLSTAATHGPAALRARPHPGAPPRLTPHQLALLPDFLGHGAEAYGFRGEFWTCQRVAQVMWPKSSSRSMACGTIAATSRVYCSNWSGLRSAPCSGLPNATKPRLSAGAGKSGQHSKKGSNRAAGTGLGG